MTPQHAEAIKQLDDLRRKIQYERYTDGAKVFCGFFAVFICFVILFAGWPVYRVWQKELSGQAQLKEAEWNRQIEIKEAEAKYEAASSLAQAEVERAKGVAQANKIIGESLKNNESYLRYLWINELSSNDQNVIYIPTETGMPILEAGKR